MNKERLNPHFNINAKYEAMIRDSKEIVKHYLSKESDGEPTEGVCLAYDVKNYLPSLLQENKELHNKIDKAIEYLETNGYGYDCCGDMCYFLDENNQKDLLEILKESEVDECE